MTTAELKRFEIRRDDLAREIEQMNPIKIGTPWHMDRQRQLEACDRQASRIREAIAGSN